MNKFCTLVQSWISSINETNAGLFNMISFAEICFLGKDSLPMFVSISAPSTLKCVVFPQSDMHHTQHSRKWFTYLVVQCLGLESRLLLLKSNICFSTLIPSCRASFLLTPQIVKSFGLEARWKENFLLYLNLCLNLGELFLLTGYFCRYRKGEIIEPQNIFVWLHLFQLIRNLWFLPQIPMILEFFSLNL